jgi:hypothetical protein
MRTRILRIAALVLSFMILSVAAYLTTPVAHAQFFRDDFEDGSATDGNPVTWVFAPEPFHLGAFTVTGNDLVISPATQGPVPYPDIPNYRETGLRVEDRVYHDVDVRTRVRSNNGGVSVIGIGLLDTHQRSDPLLGTSVNGVLIFDGTRRYMELNFEQNLNFIHRQDLNTTISPFASDVNLRFRVAGDQASFWAWPEGQAEPPVPQLTAQLPSDYANLVGHVGLFAGGGPTANPITFRFVNVVPEPASLGLFVSAMMAALYCVRRHRQ